MLENEVEEELPEPLTQVAGSVATEEPSQPIGVWQIRPLGRLRFYPPSDYKTLYTELIGSNVLLIGSNQLPTIGVANAME